MGLSSIYGQEKSGCLLFAFIVLHSYDLTLINSSRTDRSSSLIPHMNDSPLSPVAKWLVIILVALIWLLVRDRPTDKGWPSLAEIDHGKQETVATAEAIGLWEGARRVVTERYFWPVAIWFFFDCGIFFGFGALWGGPYLMDVYGMTRAKAGSILSMIAWGMIIGSPLLGYLSERVLHSRKKVIIACMTILTAEMVVLALFPGSLPVAALYLVFFIFSFCASAIVVIGFTTTKELFPVTIAGTSVGTVNLFPFLGGAVFMPLLGKILDAYPKTAAGGYDPQAYSYLLYLLCGAAGLALICSLMMKETCHARPGEKVK